jgi:hypothetical protein
MLPIASVPRLWPGATFVCLGSGPSLTVDDVFAIGCYRETRNFRVIAVNTTYQIAPWADVIYAPDPKWWGWHGEDVSARCHGLKYTLEHSEAAEKAGAQRLNYRFGGGICTDPTTVCTGGHGGFQAINVSVHLGASRILLLGYDLQADPSHGHHHHHRPHPDHSVVPYGAWRTVYETLMAPLDALGIEILNCSRATAITAIPRARLEDVLRRP